MRDGLHIAPLIFANRVTGVRITLDDRKVIETGARYSHGESTRTRKEFDRKHFQVRYHFHPR
jgi:hypothetical protein